MVSYSDAVGMILDELLAKKDVVFVSQGASNPYTYDGRLRRLWEKYGADKVLDYPLSECSMSDFVVGLAVGGMKPIMMFVRMDFMVLALDGIANAGVIMKDMLGRLYDVPITLWAIVNRGGQVDGMHSCSYVSWLAHLPRVRVFAPVTPSDIVSSFMSAYKEGGFNVIYENAEVRNMEEKEIEVKREMKAETFGDGGDVTLVAYSSGVIDALMSAYCSSLADIGIEVVDMKMIKPIDFDAIEKSVKKTGRLVVVDQSWKYCGVASEVIAGLVERGVKFDARRIVLPECAAPASKSLEKKYLSSLGVSSIVRAVREMVRGDR
jgi:pyruvate dehydrogenase E1 component beta subunit